MGRLPLASAENCTAADRLHAEPGAPDVSLVRFDGHTALEG